MKVVQSIKLCSKFFLQIFLDKCSGHKGISQDVFGHFRHDWIYQHSRDLWPQQACMDYKDTYISTYSKMWTYYTFFLLELGKGNRTTIITLILQLEETSINSRTRRNYMI